MPKIMQSLGIIPARYASSRFPGKPLVEISGKTMIQRTYEQACKSSLNAVVVATDDERIFKHVKDFNGRVVMTSPFHNTGTERCAEVAAGEAYAQFEMVVNIQGDEPYIQPSQIDLVVSLLANKPLLSIATLAKRITETEKLSDPNTVKVVFNKKGEALYFSRSMIPYPRNVKPEEGITQFSFFKHIGIYGYRRNALLEIAKIQSSQLELAESLEQLRWLENGYSIGVQTTDLETFGIDVPEDLLKLKNANFEE